MVHAHSTPQTGFLALEMEAIDAQDGSYDAPDNSWNGHLINEVDSIRVLADRRPQSWQHDNLIKLCLLLQVCTAEISQQLHHPS